MNGLVREIVGLFGAALIAIGCGMIYVPAGVIVGGMMIAALSVVVKVKVG